MSEPIEPTPNDANSSQEISNEPAARPVEPKRKRGKFRWVWRGLGMVLVLIGFLIALAPKIASTGWARSIIVPRINDALGAGQVEIHDLNFSWFDGQRIDGVRYYDEDKSMVIETNLVSGLSLWDAIRGNLNLNQTQIDANVNLVVNLDTGETNLDPAIKSKSKKKDKDLALPNLKGQVTINLRGTIETIRNGEKGPAIFIQPSVIKVDVSDINQPVSFDADLAMNVEGNPARLKLTGKADAIENRQLITDTSQLSADMKATLEQLDLAIIEAIGPLVGLDNQQLAGVGNGTLALTMAPGVPGALTSDLHFENMAAQLENGDVLAFRNVSLPLDIAIDGASQQMTINQAAIVTDVGRVDLDGVAKLTSIDRLTKLEKPDAPGSIHANISAPELERLVAMLSNTIGLRDGVVVGSGSLSENLTLTLLPDQGIRLEQAVTIQAAGKLDGKPIELTPITTNLDATINLDGKPFGDDVMKELRRIATLAFDIRSGFLNANATGNANGVNVKSSFDLQKAMDQLGQFIDFGGAYAQGNGTFNVAIVGEMADKSKPLAFNITSDANHLSFGKGERNYLTDEIVNLVAEGDVVLATNETTATIRTLSLDTASKLASLAKEGNEPAKIVMKNGVVGGNGMFHLTADVARLVAMSGRASDDSSKLESGIFDGKIALASNTVKKEYEIKLDGALTQIILGDKLKNEDVKLVGRFYTPDDMSRVSAWLDIFSSFGSVKVADAHLNLSKPDGSKLSTLEMIDTITLSGSSEQLEKVNALLQGLSASPETDVAPLKIDSGGVSFGFVLKRDASSGTIDFNMHQLAVSKLRASRGGEQFAPAQPLAGSVMANLQVDPNRTDDLVGSIEKVVVSALNINAFGIASIKMTEPISITEPTGKLSARGAVDVTGELRAIDQMLMVLTGSTSNELAGQANLDVRFATSDGAIKLTTDGQIVNFRSLSESGSKVPPQTLTVVGDVRVNPTTKTANINQLDVKTSDGETLSLAATGALIDWNTTKKLQNVELVLAYDMARIWQLLAPLIDPDGEMQIEAVEGNYENQIYKISGNLSDKRTLNGGGKLRLSRVYASGIDARDIELWINVRNGVLTFEDPKGKPSDDIVVNSGKLRLAGIEIDLASMTISAPDNYKLLSNVQINPVLTNALGKFTSAVFAKNSRADGRLDVTILSMKQLPVADLANMRKGQGAKMRLDIRNFELDGLVPNLLAQAADLGGSIRGEVKGATIEFAEGRSFSDMTITLLRKEREGDQPLPLRFAGGIALKDLRLIDYTISVPKQLIKWKELEKLPGDSFVLPVKGTATAPQFDLLAAVQKEVQNNLIRDPGGFLEGIFNKDKDKKKSDDQRKSKDSKKPDDRRDNRKRDDD